MFSEIIENLVLRNTQPGTQKIGRAKVSFRRNSSKTAHARTANKVHEDCLGLIVCRVRGEDKIESVRLCKLCKKLISLLASRLFDSGFFFRNDSHGMRALYFELHLPLLAISSNSLLFMLGGGFANAVIQMRDCNIRKRSRTAQRLQQMRERQRIRAAAYGDEQLRTARHAERCERGFCALD